MSKYTYYKDILNRNGDTIGRGVYTVPDNIVKQIKADAFDEFANKLKAECRMHYVDCEPYYGGIQDSILYEDSIDEIAEQLKAGGENV